MLDVECSMFVPPSLPRSPVTGYRLPLPLPPLRIPWRPWREAFGPRFFPVEILNPPSAIRPVLPVDILGAYLLLPVL